MSAVYYAVFFTTKQKPKTKIIDQLLAQKTEGNTIMLITHEREKMIQAIIYFAQNTHYCGKTKLFKLLYFLDFEHYKITGRSVTGLKYSAWKMGSVPTALYEELDLPDPDFASAIKTSQTPTPYSNPIWQFSKVARME